MPVSGESSPLVKLPALVSLRLWAGSVSIQLQGANLFITDGSWWNGLAHSAPLWVAQAVPQIQRYWIQNTVESLDYGVFPAVCAQRNVHVYYPLNMICHISLIQKIRRFVSAVEDVFKSTFKSVFMEASLTILLLRLITTDGKVSLYGPMSCTCLRCRFKSLTFFEHTGQSNLGLM